MRMATAAAAAAAATTANINDAGREKGPRHPSARGSGLFVRWARRALFWSVFRAALRGAEGDGG